MAPHIWYHARAHDLDAVTAAGAHQTMQVVRFYVGGRQYAIDIIELRGALLPIVDVRKRFGLEPGALTRDSKYIVVAVAVRGEYESSQFVALIVDAVLDVRRIARADIDETPPLTRDTDSGFVVGVAKWDNEIAMLLDVDRVLSERERDALPPQAEKAWT